MLYNFLEKVKQILIKVTIIMLILFLMYKFVIICLYTEYEYHIIFKEILFFVRDDQISDIHTRPYVVLEKDFDYIITMHPLTYYIFKIFFQFTTFSEAKFLKLILNLHKDKLMELIIQETKEYFLKKPIFFSYYNKRFKLSIVCDYIEQFGTKIIFKSIFEARSLKNDNITKRKVFFHILEAFIIKKKK